MPTFHAAAKQYTFTDQLYTWRAGHWVAYPPKGPQTLLLEEAHVTHAHVGSEKLYHVLAQHWYWPTLRTDCVQFV